MMALDTLLRIENGEGSEEEQFEAMQRAVNDGIAWKLQGSFGRAMMTAIEGGWVMLGREPHKDYWGNRIPSRDEVKPGTKGSRDYVAKLAGEEWAAKMEAL